MKGKPFDKTQGRLIVFEGISGTGKETQAKLLGDYLTKKGIASINVYHPSPELKEILSLWRKARQIDNVSEVYFLLADRYNRVEETIKPAIARGTWVVSLRSWVSALVYQGKTKEERKWIEEEFKRFEPKPNYLFYFDISPSEAMKRIEKRRKETGEELGKFEKLKLLEEKRKDYLKVMKGIAHISLDASRSINILSKQISSYINI